MITIYLCIPNLFIYKYVFIYFTNSSPNCNSKTTVYEWEIGVELAFKLVSKIANATFLFGPYPCEPRVYILQDYKRNSNTISWCRGSFSRSLPTIVSSLCCLSPFRLLTPLDICWTSDMAALVACLPCTRLCFVFASLVNSSLSFTQISS